MNNSVISLQCWGERIDKVKDYKYINEVVGEMRKELVEKTEDWFEKFWAYYGLEYLNKYNEEHGLYVPHKRFMKMKYKFPTAFQPLNPDCN